MFEKNELTAITSYSVTDKDKYLLIGDRNGIIVKYSFNLLLENFDIDSIVPVPEDNPIVLRGHQLEVVCIACENNMRETIAASGSKDNIIIIWDMIENSGLYQLISHHGPITSLRFLKGNLISSSKDTTMKLWDLSTKHCYGTITEHEKEIWSIELCGNRYLLSGSIDNRVKIFEINNSEGDGNKLKFCGNISRTTKGRVIQIRTIPLSMKGKNDDDDDEMKDVDDFLIFVIGIDKKIDSFYLPTTNHLKELVKKRKKKRKMNGDDEENYLSLEDDIFRRIPITFGEELKWKIRSISLNFNDRNELFLSLTFLNGNVELMKMKNFNRNTKMMEQVNKFEFHQILNLRNYIHEEDIRSLAINSSNQLVSASFNQIHLWQLPKKKNCLLNGRLSIIRSMNLKENVRKMKDNSVLCVYFVPKDVIENQSYIIIGMKSGHIQVYNIINGECIQSLEAHDNSSVWCLTSYPKKNQIISSGGNKHINIYNINQIENGIKLVLEKRLELNDVGFFLKVSHDSRLMAIALLNNTVQILYCDTYKQFLSLYGHQLPVMSLDIVHDNRIIVTGSADRTCKIWGLDFGDCRKSLIAHTDSVMAVLFIPNSYTFFSGGKDGKIKEWDAQHFTHITTIDAHFSEIWSMVINESGSIIISSSHDRCINVFEKSDEVIVPQLEEDIQIEKQYENELKNDIVTIPDIVSDEINFAITWKTLDAVKSNEKLLEAIDIYLREKSGNEEQTSLSTVYVSRGCRTSLEYIGLIMNSIRTTNLQECLMTIPYSPYIIEILRISLIFLRQRQSIELFSRTVVFLLKIHQNRLMINNDCYVLINDLREVIRDRVRAETDEISMNTTALQLVGKLYRQKEQHGNIFEAVIEKTKKKDFNKKLKKGYTLTLKS
ncbi:hypothetical protein SNEBB_005632 [Seison nebaliae]|nr:hypothetical protein SNEBB_005632 [Seison nebaliae]